MFSFLGHGADSRCNRNNDADYDAGLRDDFQADLDGVVAIRVRWGASVYPILTAILSLLNRHGPTGKLVGGLSVGGIHKEAERIDGIGFFRRIEGDEAEAATLFVSLVVAVRGFADGWIAYGIDIDLVAKSIDKFARIS